VARAFSFLDALKNASTKTARDASSSRALTQRVTRVLSEFAEELSREDTFGTSTHAGAECRAIGGESLTRL
jgi:hypothetical protein